MTKTMKTIVSSVVIIAIVLGGGVFYAHEKEVAMQQEMVKTVKENKSVIFNYIKRDYKKNGNNRKINVIEIDYSRIDRNPMGGINIGVYVNRDAENQDYSLTLNKDDGEAFVEGGAGVNFDYLDKMEN